MVRRFLPGALLAAVLIPLLFYLNFGRVGPLGWGTTVFVVALCLLAAVGFTFAGRPAYHTPVPLKGDRLDRMGAFWLVACAFGPLLGWLVSEISLTEINWRWLYGLRVILTIGLPVLTMLPLLRSARGRAALIALPVLLGVTLLPALTGIRPLLDLRDGPAARAVQIVSGDGEPCRPLDGEPLPVPCDAQAWGEPGDQLELTYLLHTRQILQVEQMTP